MKKNNTKLVGVCSAILLTLFVWALLVMPVNVHAKLLFTSTMEVDTLQEGKFPKRLVTAQGTSLAPEKEAEVTQFILEEMCKFSGTINIEPYGVLVSDLEYIMPDLFNSHPETFIARGTWGYSYTSENVVVSIKPNYLYTAEDLEKYYAELDRLVALVNKDWSDLEKLLFVHDYMAANYEYDLSLSKYTAYELFRDHTGVCQAYTLAYIAILQKLGIEVEYTSPSDMNHTWNVVQLDGKWYHIDVTWDDPTADIFGAAFHNHFLLSGTAMMEAHQNESSGTNRICDDTKYDNYYWQNVKAPFVWNSGKWYVLVNEIYALDQDNNIHNVKNICECVPDEGIGTSMLNFETSFFNIYNLGSYGQKLYYLSNSGISAYDVKNGQTLESNPNPADSPYRYISQNDSKLSYKLDNGETGAIVLEDETLYEGTEGLVYEYNEEDRTATVTGIGTAGNNIVIPSKVIYEGNTYTVISIGNGAFYNCSSLVNIEIPESVISIGNEAFSRCSSLKSIEFPSSLNFIGDSAFSGCTGLLGVIEIPNGLTSIGNGVFSGCSSLKGFEIPSSVTSIGDLAFSGCSSLVSIEIPESVISMGNGAFSRCSSLKGFEIPNSVTSIGDSAFSGCSSLVSIEIPDGVTSISNGVFNGCSSLKNIEIPEGVTSIGDSAFAGCSGLKVITIPDNVVSIGSSAFSGCSSITSIIIPDNVHSIGSSLFSNCSSLTSIIFPDGITSIGDRFFSGCSSLENIVIPDGVISIGSYAFSGCSNLTSITLPEGVISIGERAFYNCTSLTNVTIPDSVETIGDYAFAYCSNLVIIEIPDTVVSIGANTFYNCGKLDSILFSKGQKILVRYSSSNVTNSYVVPDSVTTVYDYAFSGCNSLKDVTMGENVTIIGNNAFQNCGNLRTVTMGDSVTSIGDNAFQNCGNLTTVTMGNGVTYIGENAFRECYKLSSVEMSDSVVSIGAYAFYNDQSLTAIAISGGVVSIGEGAFMECSSLKNIIIPDSVTTLGGAVFSGCTSLEKAVLGNGVKELNYSGEWEGGNGLFENCTSLKEINIPSGVTAIKECAFFNCSSLTSITIPDSVTYLGGAAFQNCASLENVTIGNGITELRGVDYWFWYYGDRGGTFENCTSLREITIPDGVTSIADKTFKGCTQLENAVVPDTVEFISGGAFEGCSSLPLVFFSVGKKILIRYSEDNIKSSYTIPDTVTYIVEMAFASNTCLTKVTIPESVEKMGGGVFYGCELLKSVLGKPVLSLSHCGLSGYNDWEFFDYGMFQNCSSLKEVSVSDDITYIGLYAFSGCSSLSSINIPRQVTTIEAYAFENCSKLQEVVIPDRVTTIGEGAFYNCSNLKRAIIGSSVNNFPMRWTMMMEEYHHSSFEGCSLLADVYFKGNAPEDEVSGSYYDGDWNYYNGTFSCTSATIYYKKGASSWTNPWEERPTVELYPQITVEPVNKMIAENKSVTFSVTATGKELSYQWYRDGIAIEGETGTSYTISNVKVSDNGVYTVSVTDILDSEIISEEAELTVVVKPIIVKQPGSATVKEDGSVTFAPEVSGIGLSYQWFKNGEPISGATDSSYTINPVKPENAGSYAVEVTNIAGTVSSELAELTVIEKVRITTQPVSQTVDEDGTVTFAVTVTGTAPISYQWYKDGKTAIQGATASSYTINPVKSEDAGSYTVRASNEAGTEVSDAVVLKVRRNLTVTLADAVVEYGSEAVLPAAQISGLVAGDDVSYTVTTDYKVGDKAGEYTITATVGGTALGDYNAPEKVTSKLTVTKKALTIIAPTLDVTYGSDIPVMEAIIGELVGSDKVTVTVTTTYKKGAKVGDYITSIGEVTGAENYAVTKVDAKLTVTKKTLTATLANATVEYGKETVLPEVEISGLYGTDDITYMVTTDYIVGDKPGIYTITAVAGDSELENYTAPQTLTSKLTVIGTAGLSYTYNTDGTATVTGLGTVFDSNIAIPNSVIQDERNYTVATIGDWAFSGCTSLISVVIPDNVKYIGNSAFYKCTNLEEIDLGNGVEHFGNTVFESCEKVTSVKIPASLENIGWATFNCCTSLAAFEVDENNPYYTAIDGILFDKSETRILRYPPAKEGTEYIVPENVTTLDDYTFENCKHLENVIIPDICTFIPRGLFEHSGICSIIIPQNVTTIGDWAFSGCTSLISVVIPDSVKYIGNSAFYKCTNLEEIDLGNGVEHFGNTVFESCEKVTSVKIPASLENIGWATFNCCTSLAAFEVDKNNPYYTAIDGILFDKSETRILRYPPAKEGIEYIVPENVTTLDDYTFENCKHLENVIIPDICTFIPRGLFEHSGICSITVPEGVTLVREYAFNGCINLTEFKFKGDAPEVLYDALPSNSGAILYYKEGKTGWTNPWYGIDTVMIENPQIINNPEDCTVIENATVTFTVTATGTDLTYQWYKDGNAIEGATGTSYTINSVQLSDNGVYTVSAKDFLNTVTVSNEAELTVVEKPVIVGNPVSAVVNEGGSVTFEAEVSGIGLSYQWFKNDEPISGATGSSYTINPVKPENAGSYAVEVTNIAGTVSSELAELTVIEKVRITTQPVSQTVDEDGTVTFAVTVTGTAPISYQWYKNGEFIDEATESSYTIISVGENDAGDYTVTVSNSANRETSDAAVLTVLIYRTHPADTNKDFVIDDMELMDYATRWLFGDPDIPDEYLMWGANIWLTGGAYGYQSDLEEPYCWVSQ